MENTSKLIKNTKVINVCDRDADIFEFLFKGVCENKYFVVRAKHDRKIQDPDSKKLFDKIKALPVAGNLIIEVPRDSKSKEPPRTAVLSVKYSTVKIPPPEYLPEKYKTNGAIEISVVLAEEITDKDNKILWILLTNEKITSLDEAIQIVKWYTQRWKIERFHYTLKSGCGVEKLQFESAEHLIKAIALYSIIAWRLLWLLYSSRENPDQPAQEHFESIELEYLKKLAVVTKTKISNELTLQESITILAKLGGFLGRKHDGDPGVKVLWRGLDKFYSGINAISAFLT